PWGAIKGYGEFRNDTAMTPEEFERIVSWVDGGVPEGEPKDLPEYKIPALPKAAHHKNELAVTGDFALTKPMTLDGLWPIAMPEKGSFKIFAELPDGSVEPLVWLQDYKMKSGHPFLF